jgi:hypothetical protein
MEFIVEFIIKTKEQKPYLIVRHLTPDQGFTVTDKSLLNGNPIEPSITSPRALTENGEPRFDLYIFTPIYSKDITKFEIGKKVVLTTSN